MDHKTWVTLAYKYYELTQSGILNQHLECDHKIVLETLDHEIYITMTYKYYEVTHCVILNQYPKYDVNPSNSVGDIKQSHWTMKSRSN